ncbi:hypothetical protein SESBI_41405 [Sesbania bispinosa]|nr:hypothetical protein SESBI_41405 [Sesbania bispinosa]
MCMNIWKSTQSNFPYLDKVEFAIRKPFFWAIWIPRLEAENRKYGRRRNMIHLK